MPIPNNETRFFQLQIRTDSVTGPVKITSNVVTVVDSQQAFIQATGGTEYINDGFKTHVFTSSNNFVISGLGIPANRNLYYEVVAGGGAGGYSSGYSQASGGGGAGGFLRGNVTLSTPGTFAMVVGGGGSTPTFPSRRGSNSSIFSNTFIALGGGNGGNYADLPASYAPGQAGGSGGGAAVDGSAGSGTPGQGNPGGPGTTPGGGGGGGAGTAGGTPLNYVAGNGLPSVSITNIPAQAQPIFGTPGIPSTGRWFAGGGAGSAITAIGGKGGGGAVNTPGTVNTGGGGGAFFGANPSGSTGGSGIVIVRYPKSAVD